MIHKLDEPRSIDTRTLHDPLVSVIIPTRNRAALVDRAVKSVLLQTYKKLEIIVVVDGPDPGTIDGLSKIDDDRLTVIDLAETVGGSQARNIGVCNSRGTWIALLDDDDEWLPEKIEYQVDALNQHTVQPLIIACQYIERNAATQIIRPRVFPKIGQPISEYLFCEISLFRPREGFLQTSTWLVQRELMLSIPFTQGLKRNQDTDWLLRAVPAAKGRVLIVNKVLAIFHNEQGHERISRSLDWKYSFEWAQRNSSLFTRKALSYFVATTCLHTCIAQNEGRKEVLYLLRSCMSTYLSPMILWFFLRHAILTPFVKSVLPSSAAAYMRRAISK